MKEEREFEAYIQILLTHSCCGRKRKRYRTSAFARSFTCSPPCHYFFFFIIIIRHIDFSRATYSKARLCVVENSFRFCFSCPIFSSLCLTRLLFRRRRRHRCYCYCVCPFGRIKYSLLPRFYMQHSSYIEFVCAIVAHNNKKNRGNVAKNQMNLPKYTWILCARGSFDSSFAGCLHAKT